MLRQSPQCTDLAAVRMLVLDCDGVLTPGDLIYDEDGRRALRFSSKDGLGLAMICRSDIVVCVLSGRPADIAEARMRELGVHDFVGKSRYKTQDLRRLADKHGFELSQVAFMGDDLPDLGAMQICGCPIAVADAADEIKTIAHWHTQANGGQGAVREACVAILKAQGRYAAWLSKFSAA